MGAVSLAMPTKLRDSAARECGRTLLYLHIVYRAHLSRWEDIEFIAVVFYYKKINK